MEMLRWRILTILLAGLILLQLDAAPAQAQKIGDPVIKTLQSVQVINDAIQGPFKNEPWFKRVTNIVTAPDSAVISFFKAIGHFLKKAAVAAGNIFKAIFKPIGNFFAFIFDWLAKLIRIGIN